MLTPTSTLRIRLRVVRDEEDAFGPGKAQLLESLLETGSLNQTAKEMKISYVKALALLRAMNAHFREPLATVARGGSKGGGTLVTDAGRQILAEYQAMRKASEEATLLGWQRLRKWLKD